VLCCVVLCCVVLCCAVLCCAVTRKVALMGILALVLPTKVKGVACHLVVLFNGVRL